LGKQHEGTERRPCIAWSSGYWEDVVESLKAQLKRGREQNRDTGLRPVQI
jgi:hypothetical protein